MQFEKVKVQIDTRKDGEGEKEKKNLAILLNCVQKGDCKL